MTAKQTIAPGKRLRVLAALGDSWRVLFRDFRRLVELTWLLTLLAFALRRLTQLASDWLDWPAVEYLEWPFSTLISASIAIRWHRHILVGETRYHEHWPRTLTFAAASLVLALLFVPIMMTTPTPEDMRLDPPSEAGAWVLLGIIGLAACIYVWIRLLLLFPHIAVRGELAIAEAWRMTRGALFRILLACILGLVPFLLVWVLISPDPEALTRPHFVRDLLVAVSGTVFIALFAGFASFLYRQAVAPVLSGEAGSA